MYEKGKMNGQFDIGLRCLNANTGGKAKGISKEIRCDHVWDVDIGREVLKNINRDKFTQVKEAREKLRYAWENNLTLVEAIGDPKEKFWSSGLDKEETKFTKEEHWPGDNNMGHILMELATEFWGPPPKVPPVPAVSAPLPMPSASILNEESKEPSAPAAFVDPESTEGTVDEELRENTHENLEPENKEIDSSIMVKNVQENANKCAGENENVSAMVAKGVKEAREKLAIFAHPSAKSDAGVNKSQTVHLGLKRKTTRVVTQNS